MTGMTAEQIGDAIRAALPDAKIDLIDLAGDNNHWAVTVTSSAFEGLSRVKQHQMVYRAIGAGVGTDVHAVQVRTQLPE